MSTLAVEWAAAQSGSPDEQAILNYLAHLVGLAGVAGPSQQTMSCFTKRSPEVVRKSLASLRERGLISWARHAGQHGANAYTLHIAGPTQPTLPGIADQYSS